MRSMETIVIMAQALSKADLSDISKLDIVYLAKPDMYRGNLTLADGSKYYIYDNGAVGILEDE